MSVQPRPGYYLYGVTRARGWRRQRLPTIEGGAELRRVRFRELEAIVATVDYGLPELGSEELAAHQRVMGILACQLTILPAPPGVVFAGRRPLVRFLDDQYLTVVEGLVLLEGHWEFRLHIAGSRLGSDERPPREVARLYTELRRLARASVSFPRRDDQLLSAAFLVERPRWIEFVEEVEDLGAAQPELALDLTGPWPPYDFVRLVA